MLSIRMTRVGSKKKPFFRVVVTEARSASREQLRRERGDVQPALEAGEGGDQQGARGALAEARARGRRTRCARCSRSTCRATCRLRLAAPARSAGASNVGRAATAAPAARCARSSRWSCARWSISPDAVRVTETRAPRHDGAGADDGAGRHGQDHRPPGTHGGGAAHAGGGDGGEARQARAARYSGLRTRARDQGLDGSRGLEARVQPDRRSPIPIHGRLGRHGARRPDRPAARPPRPGRRQSGDGFRRGAVRAGRDVLDAVGAAATSS